MSRQSRRTFLQGAALTAGGGVAAYGLGGTAARADDTAGTTDTATGAPRSGPVAVTPDDPRYASLVDRHYNRRFEGRPDVVHLVGSTAQVVRVVDEALRAGRRIAARSGGHCFENFVDDPDVRVVVDLSGMTEVSYDRSRNAFAVDAGVSLGEMYRRLYLGWGVTIPAGSCPTVGAGGHIQGGGYGPMSRLLGLSVDYLYAVEVVVVDRAGRARSVVATRDPSDPHRDLWWAHTGGGGGNFGIVTRYWLRAPGAGRGTEPAGLLPAPPASVLAFTVTWPWDDLDRATFTRLLQNHGRWMEANSAPGSPNTALHSEFVLTRRPAGTVSLVGQVSAGSTAESMLDSYVRVLGEGSGVRPDRVVQRMPWLSSVFTSVFGEPGPVFRIKLKSAYTRRGLTDEQIGVAFHHLTRTDYDWPGGALNLISYGGRVNTVPSDATAANQRDSILKVQYTVGWTDPAEDARHLGWIREFYRDMYAATGGVPAPDRTNAGAFINYADADLADPALNTSDTPWHTLYYGENYPRLQQAKARWDPRGVFHHALSVQPA